MAHEGGHRHDRLQQLLKEEVSSLLRDEVTDPRLEDVSCTRVELSVDYRSARVHFLTEGEPSRQALDQVECGLERAAPFLRARLGEALELKRVPQLSFKYDRDAAEEARATRILDAGRPPVKAVEEEE
jgi:ribosome-binding factor A